MVRRWRSWLDYAEPQPLQRVLDHAERQEAVRG